MVLPKNNSCVFWIFHYNHPFWGTLILGHLHLIIIFPDPMSVPTPFLITTRPFAPALPVPRSISNWTEIESVYHGNIVFGYKQEI